MSQALNVDWLNENALRNYPLVDGASRTSTGGLVLPNGLLVDLSLPVPDGTVSPDQVFVQSVIGFSSGVIISLAAVNQPSITIASASVFVSSHTRYASYALVGQASLLGVVGRLTVGDTESLRRAAAASYDFSATPSATRLVVSTIRPLLQGVTGIQIVDSSGAVSDILTGVVTLTSGNNITLDPGTGSVTINSTIVVPASDLTDDCGCGDGEDIGPCIRTINGIEPDGDGNFTFTGSDNLEIVPIAGGFSIDDQTTTPCCGCEQLDALYQAIQTIENEAGLLQETQEQLRGRLDTLQLVLSNSQLNPPGGGDDSSDGQTIWYLPGGQGGSGGTWVGSP